MTLDQHYKKVSKRDNLHTFTDSTGQHWTSDGILATRSKHVHNGKNNDQLAYVLGYNINQYRQAVDWSLLLESDQTLYRRLTVADHSEWINDQFFSIIMKQFKVTRIEFNILAHQRAIAFHDKDGLAALCMPIAPKFIDSLLNNLQPLCVIPQQNE